jgi:hypothetical protein
MNRLQLNSPFDVYRESKYTQFQLHPSNVLGDETRLSTESTFHLLVQLVRIESRHYQHLYHNAVTVKRLCDIFNHTVHQQEFYMVYEKHSSSKFEVVTATLTKIPMFWDMAQRRQENTCTCLLSENYCYLLFQDPGNFWTV